MEDGLTHPNRLPSALSTTLPRPMLPHRRRMLETVALLLLLSLWSGGCDTTSSTPSSLPIPTPGVGVDSDGLATPVIEERLMTRMYGMTGVPMRRGLVPFGERVLVVARPADDHTPQHIVVVDASGKASYLMDDGAFAPVPDAVSSVVNPAILRGEGIEADYADGLLALLNSDSLSDWTDSGFLDWGPGNNPDRTPTEWDTRVPLVWRESHQRTVAVLGPDAGHQGTLVVGHVGRLYRDAEGRQPVAFPSAMISTDRGRSWTWSPEMDGKRPPVGAYAAAWPDAPGGGAILYFVVTRPGDDTMPPLAIFRPDPRSESGVSVEVPYASRNELWAGHQHVSYGRSFVPSPVRHWVTRWGLMMESITEGLFWMDRPDARPRRIGGHKQTLDAPNRLLYFSARNEMMRVLPTGDVERLEDPESSRWTRAGEIERPSESLWLQAAASDEGALWLLGLSETSDDVTVATWAPGTAF